MKRYFYYTKNQAFLDKNSPLLATKKAHWNCNFLLEWLWNVAPKFIHRLHLKVLQNTATIRGFLKPMWHFFYYKSWHLWRDNLAESAIKIQMWSLSVFLRSFKLCLFVQYTLQQQKLPSFKTDPKVDPSQGYNKEQNEPRICPYMLQN